MTAEQRLDDGVALLNTAEGNVEHHPRALFMRMHTWTCTITASHNQVGLPLCPATPLDSPEVGRLDATCWIAWNSSITTYLVVVFEAKLLDMIVNCGKSATSDGNALAQTS